MSENPSESEWPGRSRGGRPRKSPASRRTRRILFRLKAREKARIQSAAARAGITLSEHVRRKALVASPKPKATRLKREELRGLGTRLNVAAHRANAEGRVDEAQLVPLLGEVRKVLRKLRLDLNDPAVDAQEGPT